MDARETALLVFSIFGLLYGVVALYLAKKTEQQ